MSNVAGPGRLFTLGVIGQGIHDDAGPLAPATERLAEAVGRAIAEQGAVTVTGGQGGVMEAAARGARDAGGLTLGLLPGLDATDANPYLDIALTTGLGRGRNLVLARGCDALVMVGGGAGTLNELTIAYAEGTAVVVVRGSGGWADRLIPILVEGRYLDERRRIPILVADGPAAAVKLALDAARSSRARRVGRRA